MTSLNRRATKVTGMMGAAAIASLFALPGLAQVNPRPSIFSEPNYDGNPATRQAPAATPSLTGVNPQPSVFTEPNYDGNPATRQADLTTTPSLVRTNPDPSVLNEPRYDGIPSGAVPAAPATTMTSTTMQMVMLDQQFMRMAAHSDQFEIRSSQLALQRSSSPEVQQYAQRMIQEHTLSTQRLTQLAAERNVMLPTAPNEFQQAVIDRLAQVSDVEFDRAYMEAQANGHMQTVGLYRTQVGQGQDAEVRQFAAQGLPAVEDHYVMASQMTGQASALDLRRPVQ